MRPPDCTSWGLLLDKTSYSSGDDIELDPVEPLFTDSLRHFYDAVSSSAGEDVTVGVIDMGIDRNHPELDVQGGMNCVYDEAENDFDDNGLGHGTHVAGIIGASGHRTQSLRGLAPRVSLKSYRVFPVGTDVVSSWSLAHARSIERSRTAATTST